MARQVFLICFLALVSGQYCTTGPTSTSDTNLGAVSLQGDGTSAITDTSNCPKTIGAKDLTSLSATLSGGKTYTVSLAATTCGGFYQSLIGAWIDYNNNGQFEPSENLFYIPTLTAGNYTGSFVVPTNLSYSGSTRLRIQIQETTTTTLNPCTVFTYGATKDFSVVLGGSSAYCNCGPTSIEDTHLGPTILQGEKNDIVEYVNPCPGTIGPVNFTDQRADMVAGITYNLALSVITCNKQYPNILTSGWIDWNQNGEFEDSEVVVPVTNEFGAIFVTFTVPIEAKTGPTGMRLQVQEILNNATTISPCDMFKYGGTKDYPVTVLSPKGGMSYREDTENQLGMSYRETNESDN